MIVKANAKINLSLDVNDKRPDGYHNLKSIILPIEMHDVIEISRLPSNFIDDYVTCDDYAMKIKKYDVVHKIIQVAREKYGFKEHFEINIHKEIFLQSGLGGGSADAGAALRGILSMLKIEATKEELIEIGIKVGSDVPFAIFNKPAIIERKGDKVDTFDYASKDYILIVKPTEGLSTQIVFGKFDENPTNVHGDIDLIKDLYIKNDLKGLNDNIFNSLEKTAIELSPEIQKIKDMLKEDGFEVVMMSGAGSSVFAITKDKKLWKKSEEKYLKLGYEAEATRFLGAY